ncbi:MAG: GntR family transcriptional regulator [Acidimicrobiales bacterium]
MPLWAQVLDDLRRRLDAGELVDEFPTDIELTSYYGVSRHTAREAVRRLQDEGVVSRERGRGTFVRAPSIEQATGAIYSLFREIEAQGIEQRSEVLDLSEQADAGIAKRFDVDPDTPFIRLERLRLAGGAVLAHDTSWMPAEVARPLLGVDFSRTALYDELQNRCGVRLTGGTERVGTELPSKDERDLLGLGSRQPVFRIFRWACESDWMVEFRETVVRGDRYAFVANWSSSGSYETMLTGNTESRPGRLRPTDDPADPA